MTVTIYSADAVLHAYAKSTSDMPALQRRYKALTAQKRFRDAFPRYGLVTMKAGHGGGSWADFRAREIRMGSGRSEAVMLHEIAHHVAYRHSQYGWCGDHGPGFASALLDVTRVALGVEAERSVRHLYRALRIRVYKAGSPKGVLPRAPGDAPEKAAPIIASIVKSRDAGKAERAMLRNLIAAMPDQTACGEWDVTCPGCGGTARLSVRFDSGWGSRGKAGLDYSGRCTVDPGCGFHEYHRVAGKAYRALRDAARANAA